MMLKAWATRNLQGFSENLRALYTTVIKQREQTKKWVSPLKEVIVGYSLIQP